MTLTVFVLTYNRCNLLKMALNSIFNQTYSDFVLWVLDNCSSDGTTEYIKTISDPRLRYTRHEENIGGAGNIKYAFEHCETDLFCVFHDDDILHKDLIKKEIDCMRENENCSAVTCCANIINQDGIIIKTQGKAKREKKCYQGDDFFCRYLNTQQNFIFPTTMYRNVFIKRNRILPQKDAGPSADVLLYMDIEKKGGTIIEIQEALFDYRVYPTQDSFRNFENMIVTLMKYLKGDEYYYNLLSKYAWARRRFLKWYGKKLIIRVASKCIRIGDALPFYNEMKNILECSLISSFPVYFVLFLEKCFPSLFNRLYRVVKRKQN